MDGVGWMVLGGWGWVDGVGWMVSGGWCRVDGVGWMVLGVGFGVEGVLVGCRLQQDVQVDGVGCRV